MSKIPEIKPIYGAELRVARLQERGIAGGYLHLVEQEVDAAYVSTIEEGVVPGLLQTDAYALNSIAEGRFSEDKTLILARVRAGRREDMKSRGAKIVHLMGERALYRQVGGLDVLAEQLDVLKEVAEQGNLHVVPVESAVSLGGVVLLDASDRPGTITAYTEDLLGNMRVLTDPAEVGRVEEHYAEVQAAALGQEETVNAIRNAQRQLII
jgi:hypothetical protein